MSRNVAFFHETTEFFGGIEVLQLQVLDHLDTRRYRPFVVIPRRADASRSQPSQFLDGLAARGVPVLRPLQVSTMPFVGWLQEAREVAGLVRRSGIDVAHIQARNIDRERKATIAARIAGVQALVRSDYLPPSIQADRLTRYRVLPFDFLTDRFITVSRGDREEQIRIVGRRADRVICSYCGVDVDRLTPVEDIAAAKAAIGLRPDLPVVGAIGRMVEQKGLGVLVEAADDILRKCPQVQILIVGDGPLRRQLDNRVDALGLRARVTFAGFQSDYVPYMQAMDIAVMPSLWEGFSLSMQEFMALAKPLVVSDHPSFLEAITDQLHGLVVPVRDSAALATAVVRLVQNPGLATELGRAASRHVRANFTIRKHVEELMQLYDELLEKRTNAA